MDCLVFASANQITFFLKLRIYSHNVLFLEVSDSEVVADLPPHSPILLSTLGIIKVVNLITKIT